MRKLFLSIKFPHQEISWNYRILSSVLTYWCIILGSTLACIILQGDRTTFWNKIKYIQVHFQVDTRKILAYSSENLKYNLKKPLCELLFAKKYKRRLFWHIYHEKLTLTTHWLSTKSNYTRYHLLLTATIIHFTLVSL